ncbi:MAG: malate dehydrogenase [Elusimicrobia bacterium]|nr:malate dehydrogenase [Elusimicrobiota bacterium]
MRKKITIVGAGNVGATLAERLHATGLVDIVVLDIPETGNMPKGKGLDMEQAGSVLRSDGLVTGTTDYKETANSDIVVITAGLPRKPGMTREQLLEINAGIVAGASRQIAASSPKAILIVVTNPLDAMCYVALKASRFSKSRVLGMAGVLDASRMERLIARKLGVSIENVSACVLGTHGETMVPIASYSTVFGVPITKILKDDEIKELVHKSVQGGAEIVELLKTGSAYYAPSASIQEMIMAILKDKKKILPCSAYLEGEFGISDTYLGIPAVLGAQGLERIWEIPLSDQEKESLVRAAQSVKEMTAHLKKTPALAGS